jgi:ABC-type bacteriocin/lantibiotic exporter with double-glycine peptidase domain
MELFNVIQMSMRDIAYYEKAKEVFLMDPEIDIGKKFLKSIQRSIVFKNLSFSYPSSPREVLSGINFEITK